MVPMVIAGTPCFIQVDDHDDFNLAQQENLTNKMWLRAAQSLGPLGKKGSMRKYLCIYIYISDICISAMCISYIYILYYSYSIKYVSFDLARHLAIELSRFPTLPDYLTFYLI